MNQTDTNGRILRTRMSPVSKPCKCKSITPKWQILERECKTNWHTFERQTLSWNIHQCEQAAPCANAAITLQATCDYTHACMAPKQINNKLSKQPSNQATKQPINLNQVTNQHAETRDKIVSVRYDTCSALVDESRNNGGRKYANYLIP